MGDEDRVICQNCSTSYDEKFLLGKQGNVDTCPMCGAGLKSENSIDDSDLDESPSFAEDVVLGENDSFDDDKIDFWWYDIREPKTLDETDTGDVYTTCAKCGYLVGSAPYPVARTGDYLLIDSRYIDNCSHCGNEMKNHILLKRPLDWVDPRQRDMWVKDYEHLPKCPTCNSTNIKKISMTNKAASAFAFGLFAAGHVSKTYKCNVCGSKF